MDANTAVEREVGTELRDRATPERLLAACSSEGGMVNQTLLHPGASRLRIGQLPW
ncbi:hypothetical protein [Streptomyces sp. NPDC048425]|uniref:hypothetical protein n=1 Tax=Streptomyces sp. NPDC048425 TaxID=3365548 RepID=UPI0037122898